MATRWDEDNVRPQCYGCNITNQGQQWLFGRYLDCERAGKAEEVMRRAQAKHRNEPAAMRAAVEHYRAEADRLTTTKALSFKRKESSSQGRREIAEEVEAGIAEANQGRGAGGEDRAMGSDGGVCDD